VPPEKPEDTKNETILTPETLVRIYLKMKEAREKLAADFKTADDKIKSQADAVKRALLTYCKNNNLESVKTAEGMFYRTTQKTYFTNDWESMGRFIVEHNCPEVLEKRLHQSNLKQFLEENPELLPPGLNAMTEYSITVRRNKQ
jgi:hypothetical protein